MQLTRSSTGLYLLAAITTAIALMGSWLLLQALALPFFI